LKLRKSPESRVKIESYIMTKKREPDSSKSRADLLIEEALKAVEAKEEAVPEEEQELVERPTASAELAAIGRVDLQKYVDREAYMRLAADFENFRKRSSKERAEAEKVGKERAVRGVLEILDNFDRALSQVQGESSPFVDGVRMILSQLEAWLKAEGFERIAAVGEVFDPHLHEAVSQVSRSDLSNGVVVQELRRGYRMGDRLLRPAGVVVNRNQEEGE
jgi:molecular chaperone GrpE